MPKVTLMGVADSPGVAAAIFGPLTDAAINVDMIVQNVAPDGKTTDMTFTVSKADLQRAVSVLESARDQLNYQRIVADSNVVKLSVIGVGMRSHAGVAQRMFRALAEKAINIQVILNVRNQGQRPGGRGIYRAGAARVAHGLRPGRRVSEAKAPAEEGSRHGRCACTAQDRATTRNCSAYGRAAAPSWVPSSPSWAAA